MRKLNNILVTGGAGFIGSNFIHYLFGLSSSGRKYNINFSGNVINVDSLTYAANLEALNDIEDKFGNSRYFFEKAEISDKDEMERIFKKYNIDTVVNFAAETHVDRAIENIEPFIKTNIIGTTILLDVSKNFWNINGHLRDDVLFHQVSTDEVYGSLNDNGYFYESSQINPKNPYSATKASGEHIVMSYYNTYGIPVTISNCSNNYGPFQFPEKFIPLMIQNILNKNNLPVYGNGENIRDWIYVEDHCDAIWTILNCSSSGERWNIGGNNELKNIELLHKLIEIIASLKNENINDLKNLIKFIKDRPGHDKRYSINFDKIKNQLNWTPKMNFNEGLIKTVEWYLKNSDWINHINTGEYKNWLIRNYDLR